MLNLSLGYSCLHKRCYRRDMEYTNIYQDYTALVGRVSKSCIKTLRKMFYHISQMSLLLIKDTTQVI